MKIVIVSVSLVLLFIAWFVWGGKESITNHPPKNERIVAFGDSLVAGVGATKGNDLMAQLSRRIGRPIENFGVAGDTTADGVQRMGEVLQRDPGLVMLLLGGNDTLRRVPIATTEANLRLLIEAFQKQGAVVMFLGVRGGIVGSEREDMYERVSEVYDVVFVPDILDGILLTPELMYDTIHPNDAGYAKIAERLAAVMEEYEL